MKTAMAENKVVTLILVLLMTVALIAVAVMYSKNIKGGTGIEACRDSVLMASATKKFKLNPAGVAPPIKCPRSEVSLKASDFTSSGELNDLAIKKAVADEVKNCWYKMSGDQQLNPYQEELGNKMICLVCSEISFDPDIYGKLKTIDNLRQYMDANGYGSATNRLTLYLNKIDTTKKYYLIYYTFSPKIWVAAGSMPVSLKNGILDLVGIEGKSGADSWSNMYLIPPNNLPELGCETIKG